MLVTTNKETQKMRVLNRVLFICYLVQCQKDKGKDVLTLLNSRSKVNAMTLAYMAQLGLKMQKINVGTLKIDESLLTTHGIVIVAF